MQNSINYKLQWDEVHNTIQITFFSAEIRETVTIVIKKSDVRWIAKKVFGNFLTHF